MMLLGLLLFLGLFAVFSALLLWLSGRTSEKSNDLVEAINEILPQTQCGQCGYPGCKPYAEAIATGAAPINQCPPGGDAGIAALAALLDVPILALNAEHGEIKPKAIARIHEADCIGCTLCIKACPVDAIIGSAKHMHTVIADDCTGCALCVPPCPVDCIEMIEKPHEWRMPIPDQVPIRKAVK